MLGAHKKAGFQAETGKRRPVPPVAYGLRPVSGQVVMPKIGYSGQKRNSPVASGITPSQPHQPITPKTARRMSTAPRTMRRMRSIPPTFVFMIDFP